MGFALVIILFVSAVVLYTAWLNRVFSRCPHCRKIGSWRFDPAEPEVCNRDEDGDVVQSSRQVQVCRKCKNRVLDSWSDHDGRSFKKITD